MAHAPTILNVPGLNNSGPTHWQTLWERSHADTVRADLGLWDRPHRNLWVTKLDQAIRTAQAPVILVGHSLGCLAIAWWAELSGQPWGWPVAGALLVAPADVDRRGAPAELREFAPSPRTLLPFPSLLVASRDDPWIAADRARSLAGQWGSIFVDAGPFGHLNAASGIGDWAEGRRLLDRLVDTAPSGRAPDAREAEAILADEQARPRETAASDPLHP